MTGHRQPEFAIGKVLETVSEPQKGRENRGFGLPKWRFETVSSQAKSYSVDVGVQQGILCRSTELSTPCGKTAILRQSRFGQWMIAASPDHHWFLKFILESTVQALDSG
jgi:hypothetical protein